MTITVTDIKLKKPERLTDNPDGGGRQTALEVIDGELNNIFQDISRLDRTTGRASLRKAFVHVDTDNTDTLLGTHIILTQPPEDPGVHVCMFGGGTPTDERSDARNRVESYVIAGPPAPYWLYGNHVTGQRTIRVTCRSEAPSPEQAETLLLRQFAPGYPEVEQYVRIESIDSRTTQTFTDAGGDYQRDVIVMTILAPLRQELTGIDVPPRFSTETAPTEVRRTQVADAARYYSVMPLDDVAAPGDLSVKVATPYVPIVPTATAESALIDRTPYGEAASFVASGAADAMELSVSLDGVPENSAASLFFGSPFVRGTLRITIGGVLLLKDNGDGALVPLTPGGATDGYGGSCDYANGALALQRTSGWSALVSASATAAGSVRFTVAGRRYFDRVGALYHSVNALTNAATLGGSLSLSSGEASISDYIGGGAANGATIESLLTVRGDAAVNTIFFRIPVQSLKRATLSIRGTRIDTGALVTGTADINGVISGTGIEGEVDAEMAIVRVAFGEWLTAAGNEGEAWYVPDAVVAGEIFRPIAVDPSSIRYNAVSLKSIPVDADVIQVDPVRLPVDGRVPWLRPGNVVVVHHTGYSEAAAPDANDVTDLGRERLTHVRVRDSEGTAVETAWYTVDLQAGTVTWADPLDLSAYELPITVEHRVEDMVQVSDVLISGEIGLSRALTHDFPEGSCLSSALIPVPQDLESGVSNVFAQTTWTNEWSDSLIGDAPASAYNTLAYPIEVVNSGAMTGRYRIHFVGTTSFSAFLEGVGGLGPGDTSADFAPINPLTGEPYFVILAAGWGSGWSAGNVLRFNIQGAAYPMWIARCTLQGPLVEPTDSVRMEIRGDAD